jgi:class 3 adenylate cyclase
VNLPRQPGPTAPRWLAPLAAVAATVVALALDASTRWPRVFGYALHDAQVQLLRSLRPVADDSVVLVGIDQATVDAIAAPLALWHRELGLALEALAAARPRLVALDIVLPERSFDALVPGLDRALLRGLVAVREAGGVVLALQPDAAGRLRTVHPPLLAAAGEAAAGAAVYRIEPDGVVRFVDPAVSTFVVAMARRLAAATPDTAADPAGGFIDYTRGAPFDYVPLHDVLRWRASGATDELQRRFAGRIVLVGSVLPLVDRRAQPVALAGWESSAIEPPGLLIHAQAARSLNAGGLIRAAGLPWVATAALVLALAGAADRFVLRWALLALLLAASLAAALLALRGGLFIPLGVPWVAGVLAAAGRSTWDGWRHLAERDRVARTFAGYVSPQVFDAVLAGTVLTRGHGRLAFLFADVRGFTSLTEATAADTVLDWLNAYYAAVTPILHAQGATIDSFRGDGVTALFGAPQPLADAPARALEAARSMLRAVEALNAGAAQGTAPVRIGIGLAYGDAVFGDLGSPDRRDFTAIGDDVNVAARLQDLTKSLGCPILLTDALRANLPGTVQAGLVDLGVQEIKGHTPVRVWGARA